MKSLMKFFASFVLLLSLPASAENVKIDNWQKSGFSSEDDYFNASQLEVLLENRSGESMGTWAAIAVDRAGTFSTIVNGRDDGDPQGRTCSVSVKRNGDTQEGTEFPVEVGDRVIVAYNCTAATYRNEFGSYNKFWTFVDGHYAITGEQRARAEECPSTEFDKANILGLPLIRTVTSAEEDAVPVPDQIAEPALKTVGFFEAGGPDRFRTVSALDGISIGYLQWNHDTGSLYKPFLAAMSDTHIAQAPASIRDDLARLHRRATRGRASDVAASERVLASWRGGRGIRTPVKNALRTWLGHPEIIKIQKKLADPKIRLAYSYARKWLGGTDNVDEMVRTTTFFFDVIVYNGSRKKMWLGHARAFRAKFASDAALLAHVSDWLTRCKSVVRKDKRGPHQRLYNVEEAAENGVRWADAAKTPGHFSDNQLDLLAFGYMFAIRSIGSNGSLGFPGIFQADLMMRRGAIALSSGTVRGRQMSDILAWANGSSSFPR